MALRGPLLQRTLVGCSLALVASGCLSAPGLRLTQRLSETTATGGFESNEGPGAIDFGDVDLDDAELVYEVRAEVDLRHVVLLADLRRLGLSGNGTLPIDFDLDGTTFDQNDTVRATSSIKFLRGLLLWKLLPDAALNLDVGLGIAAVDTSFSLRDVASGDSAGVDGLGLVPFLAGRARYRIGDFEIEGLVNYADGSFDLTDLHFLDVEVAGRWRFAGEANGFSAWAELGYRETDLVVDFLDDPGKVDSDFGLRGPFVGLVVQF